MADTLHTIVTEMEAEADRLQGLVEDNDIPEDVAARLLSRSIQCRRWAKRIGALIATVGLTPEELGCMVRLEQWRDDLLPPYRKIEIVCKALRRRSGM